MLQASSGEAAKAVYHLTAEQVEKLAKLGYLGNADAPHGEMAKLPDPKDEIDTFYLINRAGVEAGGGHCDRAVPALLEVLEKAPNVVAAHTMLGRCYFLLEKYDESLRAFERLQTLSPENSDASFYIAASQFKLDDLSSAQAGFEHIVKLDPKRAYAHKYLGFIYQAQGKPELAVAEFEKVIETMPNDIEAHGKLGFLLASASRMAEALPHFQRVVALDPADGSAHYNLGLAYEKSGDQAKATRELAAACKLEKNFCGK
jgi:tetratricopeptide (TPR) repeat protein